MLNMRFLATASISVCVPEIILRDSLPEKISAYDSIPW